MKEKRIKYLAFKENGSAINADQIKEFESYNIKVKDFNELELSIYY
jgi:hypothetical protein